MDNSNETRQYIEAIKFAAGSLQYQNISVKQTFHDSISQLFWYYDQLETREYLEIALLHIQAYCEMGFQYEENKELFDRVLAHLGTTRELQFPKKFYLSKKIKLNKSQVKSMIKKWPASPHQSMKIDDVVTDIITKVQNKQNGIYYYKCAVTGDLYELVVSNDAPFFHDIARGIFYTFAES